MIPPISTIMRALVLALLLITGSAAIAQMPRTISYQGVLADGVGNLLRDGNYKLTFTLYDAVSGGSAIWSESQNIPVVRGTFNALLGSSQSINSSITFDRAYFLGVSVEGAAELVPRTPLAAAPYAIYAEQAGSLAPGASGVVTSINGSDGELTLIGAGSTTINRVGRTITVSSSGGSGGSGIQGVQSTDAAIQITNGSGPVASMALADGGIAPEKMSHAGALPGQVLTYNGSNVVWKAGNGIELPYKDTLISNVDAFTVVTKGTGRAGIFRNIDTIASNALYGELNSVYGVGVEGRNNSTAGYGVLGRSGVEGAGVVGLVKTGTDGTYMYTAGSGITGFSDTSDGVSGISSSTRRSGVNGWGTNHATGVHGESYAGKAGVFEIKNTENSNNALIGSTSGSGAAVEAVYSYTGSTGIALQITNGAIKVAGTYRPAFRHTATAANITSNYTRISHPMCDGDSTAILIVTPTYGNVIYNAHPIAVFYSSTSGKWAIYNEDLAAMPVNKQFNVLVIKQ